MEKWKRTAGLCNSDSKHLDDQQQGLQTAVLRRSLVACRMHRSVPGSDPSWLVSFLELLCVLVHVYEAVSAA